MDSYMKDYMDMMRSNANKGTNELFYCASLEYAIAQHTILFENAKKSFDWVVEYDSFMKYFEDDKLFKEFENMLYRGVKVRILFTGVPWEEKQEPKIFKDPNYLKFLTSGLEKLRKFKDKHEGEFDTIAGTNPLYSVYQNNLQEIIDTFENEEIEALFPEHFTNPPNP